MAKKKTEVLNPVSDKIEAVENAVKKTLGANFVVWGIEETKEPTTNELVHLDNPENARIVTGNSELRVWSGLAKNEYLVKYDNSFYKMEGGIRK